MEIASTNGVTVAYDHHGGDGPPLLLAHATGFCAGAYQPAVALLRERFSVWTMDFRGHGLSTRPTDGHFGWDGMIDDVLAVTGEIGEPVFGFGHSMGGACLLGAERRTPGTLRAAWVFEPIVIPDEFADDEPTQNPLSEAARRRRPTFPSRAEALHRYASRPPLGAFRADMLWHYVETGFVEVDGGPEVELRCRPDDEAATFTARNKPTSTQMADLDIDVTIAIGEGHPGPGPALFARKAAEHLKRGTLRTFPTLGHFGPFQDPDLVVGDVVGDLLG